MFRYNFVPLKETRDGRIAIAVADPTHLMWIDEISLLLGKRIISQVATRAQIAEILNTADKSRGVDANPTQMADRLTIRLARAIPTRRSVLLSSPNRIRAQSAMAVPEQEQ